ncbi:MAG: TerC family protein [Planctomycetota bacterium]
MTIPLGFVPGASVWVWAGFIAFVLGMLVLDLVVFHRKAHEVKLREAILWSVFWITLALVFNVVVWRWKGVEAGQNFLAGYVLEKSMSVDNLFVFLLLFGYFAVPARYQHRILFWGIIGALVLRGVFIAAGAALIVRFHWILYVFGLFLVVTGVKMAFQKDKEVHPDRNPMLRLLRKFLPVTGDFEGGRFFERREGRTWATPLLVVLVAVETTDVVFAVDSIPAIFGITTDPFIVFTSNVFAILGLRALFFALAGFMKLFHYLNYGLSFILVFVGAKMLVADVWKISTAAALGVIGGTLAVSVLASLMFPKPETPVGGKQR